MNRSIYVQKSPISGKYIVFSPDRSVPFGKYASYDAALRRKGQVENSQRPKKET